MTVIRPNGITGITSITALNDTISVYKSDGTTAGLQLDGVNFNTTGVSTVGQLNTTTLTVNSNNYPSAGPLSNRNLIINGAMQVAQRGTVVNAGLEYGGPDRFYFGKNDGAFTISQDTDVPSGQGFANSWKADVTSTAGAAGSFYVTVEQRFEGLNLQSIKKGTSNAESLTLSFWIKSTKTGTYIAELYDHDNDRQISKSYTVNSADTWEKKTITYPADTTGTFGNDNDRSLTLILWLYAGSTWTSGTLNDTAWGSGLSTSNRAVGQVNAADNTANNIYITGVQLEVGETATPFEHRSYGDELRLCERYFQILEVATNTYGAQYATVGSGLFAGLPLTFNTKMRVAPTSVTYNGISGTSYWVQTSTTAFSADSTTGQTFATTDSSVRMHQTRQSGNNTPAGSSYYVWEPSFELIMSAEL